MQYSGNSVNTVNSNINNGKMNITGSNGRLNGINYKEFQNVAVGCVNGVFLYKKMSGRFAEPKKMGRNNEVSVRWGSIVPNCRT